MNEYQDMIDQAEDRDILNDIETPEYKLLEETWSRDGTIRREESASILGDG